MIFVSFTFATYGIRSLGNARFPSLETAVSVFNAHSFGLAHFFSHMLIKMLLSMNKGAKVEPKRCTWSN